MQTNWEQLHQAARRSPKHTAITTKDKIVEAFRLAKNQSPDLNTVKQNLTSWKGDWTKQPSKTNNSWKKLHDKPRKHHKRRIQQFDEVSVICNHIVRGTQFIERYVPIPLLTQRLGWSATKRPCCCKFCGDCLGFMVIPIIEWRYQCCNITCW